MSRRLGPNLPWTVAVNVLPQMHSRTSVFLSIDVCFKSFSPVPSSNGQAASPCRLHSHISVIPNGTLMQHHPCGFCCSYSGGSYQQHLGMLEQWIDGNGRAQATPTSSDGRRRKGAKGAGQYACSLLCTRLSLSPCLSSRSAACSLELYPY